MLSARLQKVLGDRGRVVPSLSQYAAERRGKSEFPAERVDQSGIGRDGFDPAEPGLSGFEEREGGGRHAAKVKGGEDERQALNELISALRSPAVRHIRIGGRSPAHPAGAGEDR